MAPPARLAVVLRSSVGPPLRPRSPPATASRQGLRRHACVAGQCALEKRPVAQDHRLKFSSEI
ncbi:hypothetical protein U9M48_034881 [Paspalum notatum var. saurae]|uniref:Uncharacterized protein n=1 Tax=Paspalum notatum var. saurae TaxID=547442 RepID=A0AAQ3UAK4_PASNO